MDLQQLSEQLKTLNSIQELIASGGATTVAQSHLIAKYLSQGYQLEPWSKTQTLASWGGTALTDIEVEFETPNCPVILTDLMVNQWLTTNTDSSTVPVGRILRNAGLDGDGAALRGGLSFQVQLKSDHRDIRPFFDGYLLSSAFEGPLHDRLPLGVGLEQKKATLTLTVQTLVVKSANDVYSARATLFGLMAVK